MKIQFFDPFANIWPHSYPIARVMARFAELGHNVEVVRCNGTFSSHCIAMSAANLSYQSSLIEKQLVCRTCRKRSHILDQSSKIDSRLFEDYLDSKDIELAKEAIVDCHKENWENFIYRGVPVGAMAAYEILLTHKVDSRELPAEVWSEFISNLINTILVVVVSERILRETMPDRVIVYNSLYSLNNAYSHVARSLGIPTFTVQGGPHVFRRTSTLTCFTEPSEIFSATYASEVSEWLSAPLDFESISIVSEHLQHLLLGESAFAYSSAPGEKSKEQLAKKFGVSDHRPVLTALLSSEDEFFAANLEGAIPQIDAWVGVFENQTQWIRWLLEFASRHPELQLVIRVHPRMLPNKRENKVSAYSEYLRKILTNVPENVFINWPTDEISIYDLMQYTDVVLNKRSSAGIEMMAYGLPVVLPGNEFVFSCPPDICLVAKDEASYEELIIQALEEGWSIENVRKAYRWLGFLFRATTVDVRKVSGSKVSSLRPKKSRTMLAIWRVLTFIYLQSGFTRSENKQMGEIRNDLETLDDLVNTILGKHNGLHKIRRRNQFSVANEENESKELQEDLQSRLSLLVGDSQSDLPIVNKFHASMQGQQNGKKWM